VQRPGMRILRVRASDEGTLWFCARAERSTHTVVLVLCVCNFDRSADSGGYCSQCFQKYGNSDQGLMNELFWSSYKSNRAQILHGFTFTNKPRNLFLSTFEFETSPNIAVDTSPHFIPQYNCNQHLPQPSSALRRPFALFSIKNYAFSIATHTASLYPPQHKHPPPCPKVNLRLLQARLPRGVFVDCFNF